MKNKIQVYFKYEKTFKNKKIDELAKEIKELKNIKLNTINVCEHICKNGKTIIIVLQTGLLEIHELLSKNLIYLCVNSRKQNAFNKIKKELELLND